MIFPSETSQDRKVTIRAGVCVNDITPDEGSSLFGCPGVERTAGSVHDPLEVSVLHIRNGSAGIFLVSLDLLCLDHATCKSISSGIASRLGVHEENIFIGCSHNHSGPATTQLFSWVGDTTVPKPDDDYMTRMWDSTVHTAAEAAATTVPVGVTSMRVKTRLPDGTISETDVLAVREIDSGVISGIVVLSDICPDLLGHLSTEISADFPYYLRKQLRARYGESLAVLHFTSPCDSWKLDHFETEDPHGRAEHVGTALADAISANIDSLSPERFASEISLMCGQKEVELPRRTVPRLWDARVRWGESQAEYMRLQQSDSTEKDRWDASCEVAAARALLNHAYSGGNGKLERALAVSLPAAVQVVRIGDLFIAGLPGMLAAEYGARLTEMANREVFIATGVGGNLQGYIVPTDVETEGRNRTMLSPFANESGMVLVKAALSLLN